MTISCDQSGTQPTERLGKGVPGPGNDLPSKSSYRTARNYSHGLSVDGMQRADRQESLPGGAQAGAVGVAQGRSAGQAGGGSSLSRPAAVTFTQTTPDLWVSFNWRSVDQMATC